MVQKEKLVQFYFNQYRDWSRAYKKKNNEGKKTYEQRIDRLLEDMQAPRGRLSQAHLEEFHRQLRNLAYFSFREENRFAIMKIRDLLLGLRFLKGAKSRDGAWKKRFVQGP